MTPMVGDVLESVLSVAISATEVSITVTGILSEVIFGISLASTTAIVSIPSIYCRGVKSGVARGRSTEVTPMVGDVLESVLSVAISATEVSITVTGILSEFISGLIEDWREIGA